MEPVPSTLLLPETWTVPASIPIAPLYPLLLPLRASVPALSFVRLPVPLSVELMVRLPAPLTSATLLAETAIAPPLITWLDADCWMMLGTEPSSVSVFPPCVMVKAPAAESNLMALAE